MKVMRSKRLEPSFPLTDRDIENLGEGSGDFGKLQEHELIFRDTQGLEVKLKKIEVFRGKEIISSMLETRF